MFFEVQCYIICKMYLFSQWMLSVAHRLFTDHCKPFVDNITILQVQLTGPFSTIVKHPHMANKLYAKTHGVSGTTLLPARKVALKEGTSCYEETMGN